MKRIEIFNLRKGNKHRKTNSDGVRFCFDCGLNRDTRNSEFDIETSAPSILVCHYNDSSSISSELSDNPGFAKKILLPRESSEFMAFLNNNFDFIMSISTRGEIMITKSILFEHFDFIPEKKFAAAMSFEKNEAYFTAGKFLEKYIASVPEIIRDIQTTCYQFRFPGVEKTMILEMLAGKETFATWIYTITGKLEKQLQEKFNAPVTLKIALHEQVLKFDDAEKLKTDEAFANVINTNLPFALHLIVFGNTNPLNWFRITLLPRPQQQLFKPESEYPLLIVDYSPNAADPVFNAAAETFAREVETIFNLAPFDEKAIFPQFTEEDVN
jgi:hypothetical protein